MRYITTCILAMVLCWSCSGNKKVPDVSHIKITLQEQRFEQDFFAIDTNNIDAAIPGLSQKYPFFLADFVQNILGLSLEEHEKTNEAIRIFLRDYQLVKDTADKVFSHFSDIKKEITKGLQFAKYYFPDYELPEKLITFIGPLDAIFQTPFGKTGDVITRDALAVALQLHLGADASLYQSQIAQSIFPKYISRRFTPDNIAVNAIKNVVDDIFPGLPNKTLLDHAIDKGKRLYLLDRFMPNTPDELKTGYTKEQLKGAYDNEGLIWSFLAQNDLLYNSDQLRIQSYVEESPYTQELGEGSPGNIALFMGWQMVKKYMEKFPDTGLEILLATDAQTILHESKYKPR